MFGDYARRYTKESSRLFMQSYQLEQAKAFWESQPKSKYHFWKKDTTTPEHIYRNTIARMKYFASKQTQTD